jgi:predicted ATPase
MKLSSLVARNYRSLRDTTIVLGDFTLFIGANASGKSAILDALRFLSEAVQARDFRAPVFSRGGILNLAWKGQEANQVELVVKLEDKSRRFEWSARLMRQAHDFHVEEQVYETPYGSPPIQLLSAERGEGWWWSGERGERVPLKQPLSTCALAAASADASFPAREIAEFVGRWGFFDPNPFLLRRDWSLPDSVRFDTYGRNLGETLYALWTTDPHTLEKIVSATRSVVGIPSEIEPRESEDRFYFVQREPGLQFPVNQMGVSSGTLRMLALMTALHGQPATTLIGIEEPENYIHPSALSSFVEHILDARDRVQFMVTTHSPLLLDSLDDPAAVNVVRRDDLNGTTVLKESDPASVRKALEASGFGLGEYYETRGFGG